MTPAFLVRAARWSEDAPAIAAVRRAVFIEEQGVPEALEWEAGDGGCQWFVAEAGPAGVIGVCRLTPEGRIGRMAVLPAWRGAGVGSALLRAALAAARLRGHGEVRLSAQCHALAFYTRHGFAATGEVYLDAGIAHREMTLSLGVPA